MDQSVPPHDPTTTPRNDPEYIAFLEQRIATLETTVPRMNQRIALLEARAPKTNLVSPKFWTRAWAVYGHQLAIGAIIYGIMMAIYAVIGIVFAMVATLSGNW